MQYRSVDPGGDLDRLQELFDECASADRHAALSEHKYLDLIDGGTPTGWVAEVHSELIGYVHVITRPGDPSWVLELVLHPRWRKPQTIEDLLSFVIARKRGGGGIRVWVYQPAVARVVTSMGFRVERELVQMRMDLPCGRMAPPVPELEIAPFRTTDAAAWIAVNNRAFAGHPENGAWTLEMLTARTQMPRFDPAGLLMGWSNGRLIGFCWTKMHPDGIGEIYVIGVEPEWQGRSVGKRLTLEGLRYLHEDRGAGAAMLYVDADAVKAVRMYRSIGFTVDHIDRSFIRSA